MRNVMPNAWSDKDERMYEHVLEGARRSGSSPAIAKELAARVVNKQRRSEGRTPNNATHGTGNPHTVLDERSRDELYHRAKELDIRGRSRMTKHELVAAIRTHWRA